MSRQADATGRGGRGLLPALVALALVLGGCAVTPPPGASVAPAAVAADPVVTTAPPPSPTPTLPTEPTTTPPTEPVRQRPTAEAIPVNPLYAYGRSTRAAFRRCLKVAVAAGTGGECALLVEKRLRKAGFYPWGYTGSIDATAVNAILNYQRSRGITGTGTVASRTWRALVTNAPSVSRELPKKCLTKGIVLCVDQAHRRLVWLRNGHEVRTFKVRLGGYNSHPKTGDWRVFPTANGTWHVYDKQVDPPSDNYGSGAMPYSVMFNPDMYVHYSPGFHAVGYQSSSHGCVNIGDLGQAIWIFKHTPIGAKVYVYSRAA